MKAIIYHSNSNKKRSETVAFSFDGDRYEVKPVKQYKSTFMQMLMYGYKTTFKKRVEYVHVGIDFDKYKEIVLVSPVWAGKVNAVMRTFLLDHKFHDKKVTLVGTSDGENNKYFESYKGLIDGCCEIVGTDLYIKGNKK
ncbi:flavodoxin [Candidatus Izimaplasma bacterium HR1]|uniref:hypothetical protein n=1 Tax=Candidatus Izimoplasma sp. HR1 TaxID=1541959 RepID=UPI0004F5AF0D|nr:flavodoxin [Candidatus Izimaplasma bacterium HR1]